MKEIACDVLFEKGHTIAEKIFEGVTYPYEVLPKISEFYFRTWKNIARQISLSAERIISGLLKSASVAPSAYFMVRRLLMKRRKSVTVHLSEEMPLLEKAAVVGNSTELKNVILFDKVQVPHYNYVGDRFWDLSPIWEPVLTSNVKSDKTLVVINR